jgi:hypothetical protein
MGENGRQRAAPQTGIPPVALRWRQDFALADNDH